MPPCGQVIDRCVEPSAPAFRSLMRSTSNGGVHDRNLFQPIRGSFVRMDFFVRLTYYFDYGRDASLIFAPSAGGRAVSSSL